MKEKVSISDNLTTSKKIGGYVTIIKNQGKPNEEIIQKRKPNLLTTDGRDFFHAQVYTNTTAGTVAANFIALSDDSGAPTAADTILTGEITTGGLARVVASSIVHVDDSDLTTLTEVFTATAVFSGIHKSGLFNASSGGTMTHTAAFSADVDLQIGDTLTVTWDLTLG